MTIKEEMQKRRNEAKEQIKDELQREVENLRKFTVELQKEKPYDLEFSFSVYEAGKFDLEVDSENPKLYFSLKNTVGMKPEFFRKFLEERLKEEGVELTENTLKISLLEQIGTLMNL